MSSRSKATSKRNGLNGNGGHVEDPKAQWSTQAYSLEDLSKQFTFPQVVRCNSTLMTKKDSPLPVNLGQPMLLYDTRTIRKLLARNVLYDPRIRRYNETDETVVIPSDYEGHFVRLSSRTAKDHTVHKSIDSIISCKIPAFLNLTSLTAFQLSPNKTSNDYPRMEYAPGNVFIVDKVITGTAKVKPDQKSARAKSPHPVMQDVHYLKCRDERETSVIIPVTHPGEFAEILPNPFGNGKLSLMAEDIMTTQNFPMVVRYVYGGNKPRLTQFSGLFTLLDSFEETSVLACVLNTSGFTLIEFPISSSLSFQLALNSHDLFHLPVLKSAIRLCEKKAGVFRKDLKFKFKFVQKILENGHPPPQLETSMTTEISDLKSPSATNTAKLGITQTYFYL